MVFVLINNELKVRELSFEEGEKVDQPTWQNKMNLVTLKCISKFQFQWQIEGKHLENENYP